MILFILNSNNMMINNSCQQNAWKITLFFPPYNLEFFQMYAPSLPDVLCYHVSKKEMNSRYWGSLMTWGIWLSIIQELLISKAHILLGKLRDGKEPRIIWIEITSLAFLPHNPLSIKLHDTMDSPEIKYYQCTIQTWCTQYSKCHKEMTIPILIRKHR